MPRTKLLAGNWKMNKTPQEALALVQGLLEALPETRHTVAVFPPYLALERVVDAVGDRLLVGAQNCHFEAQGAFTGEVSLPMLSEVGARAVLVGHSERRQFFGETDESVNKKTKAALAAGLIPFVCIGETLPERRQGGYLALLERQLRAALDGLPAAAAGGIVVAYEPVWAIGTGVTATDGEAEEVCALLRALLGRLYGEAAAGIRILYGGSMNAQNAAGLLASPSIDGGLIGGASLKPQAFAAIVAAANEVAAD